MGSLKVHFCNPILRGGPLFPEPKATTSKAMLETIWLGGIRWARSHSTRKVQSPGDFLGERTDGKVDPT